MKTQKKETIFRQRILKWYKNNGRNYPWRNKSANNYQKIIAEFLLKRTTAKTAGEFFYKFTKKYPSWKRLSCAKESELRKILKPIGLYNQRAKLLVALSKELTTLNGIFPKDENQILKLPGVGRYVSNAVLLFCHKRNAPLFDSNMSRTIGRVFLGKDSTPVSNNNAYSFAEMITKSRKSIEVNWGILDYSALVCHYRYPKCDTCKVNNICSIYIK